MDSEILSRINTQIEELEKRIKSLSMQVTINTYNNVFKSCLDDIKNLLADFEEELSDHIENCEYLEQDFVKISTNQTISGLKTFSSGIKIGNGNSTADIILDSNDKVVVKHSNIAKMKIDDSDTLFANSVSPEISSVYDLGKSGACWRDLYLAGSLSDGINAVAISNIAKKSTISDYTLLASNWSNNQYTLAITGKLASNNAVVSNSNSGSTNADILANSEAIAGANIYRIIDNGTSLTFVCENTPTVDLKIQVEVCE